MIEKFFRCICKQKVGVQGLSTVNGELLKDHLHHLSVEAYKHDDIQYMRAILVTSRCHEIGIDQDCKVGI